MAGRPALPMGIKRSVLVEAGHRCAIPTCRSTPVEVAHIRARGKGGPDSFENLIALCPTCHTRYDNGEIDEPSMRIYKGNLSVITSRYGDLEQRVLKAFGEAQAPAGTVLELPGGLDVLLMYLLEDRLIVPVPVVGAQVIAAGIPARANYALTDEGAEFIRRWLSAEPVDPSAGLA